MYTVLGATGNIGSVVTRILLDKGERVRVYGRHLGRLQAFAQKGAEAFVGDVTDALTLTKAFTGARAAFLMVPPAMRSPDYRRDQERATDGISIAARNAGLQYAVNLSSVGAHLPSRTGPILGLHFSERKLNVIDRLNVLHLRPAYFFENLLPGISMIQMMGIFGGALKGNLRIPMIATRDIGAYVAERLCKLDFTGKSTQDLLGQRDLRMSEVVAVMGKALGKAELRYVQFPYDEVEKVLVQLGTPHKTAALFTEMFRAFNDGTVAPTETRTAGNTTPTSIEDFVKEKFVPAYQGMAVGA
jgi:uncharacterized protein YbjT (DUF2867 family)